MVQREARHDAFAFRSPLNKRTSCGDNGIYVCGADGPLWSFNPTNIYFQDEGSDIFNSTYFTRYCHRLEIQNSHGQLSEAAAAAAAAEDKGALRIAYKWTTRNNRKGHHALAVSPSRDDFKWNFRNDRFVSTRKRIAYGVRRMFCSFPFYDISFITAILFTIGSVLWVADGVALSAPLIHSSMVTYQPSLEVAGGCISFIATVIYVVANILQFLELVNEKRKVCFGWRITTEYFPSGGDGQGTALLIKRGKCKHHHKTKENLVRQDVIDDPDSKYGSYVFERDEPDPKEEGQDVETSVGGESKDQRHWSWFPSFEEIRTHYARDLGFFACVIQILGVALFVVGAFARLPRVYDRLGFPTELVLLWIPKTLGSIGFTISSAIFMLETQERWYAPAFQVVGWHAGAWNVVGGVAFLIGSSLGLYETIQGASGQGWAVYQSALATLWGGLCYFIGGLIFWFEALEKYSVLVQKSPHLEA